MKADADPTCSLAALGVWYAMRRRFMADEDNFGVLVILNRRRGLKDAALLADAIPTSEDVRALLVELYKCDAIAFAGSDGAIICHDMIWAARRREVSRANGRKGGNPRLLRAEPESESA